MVWIAAGGLWAHHAHHDSILYGQQIIGCVFCESCNFLQKLLNLFFPIWEKQNIAKAQFDSRVVNWDPELWITLYKQGL